MNDTVEIIGGDNIRLAFAELNINAKFTYKSTHLPFPVEVWEVSVDDLKKFYLSMYFDSGLKPNTIHSVNTILHPIFTLAVRDGYIRSNPAYQVYAELKKQNAWCQEKRHALTEQQQSAFVDYIRNSSKYRKWLNMFTLFLGTGCRVGEVIGLRWEDCDFAENIISINHNLVYCKADDKKFKYYISTPKTKAGERIIPMLKEVRKALLEERISQMQTGFNQTVIDGYSGFIFQNRNGGMRKPTEINKVINRIIADYNAEETEQAKKKRREPILLPHFSVHNLRHTFCTRFCENETNLKIIQEIMGHANISTTMDSLTRLRRSRKRQVSLIWKAKL